MHLPVFHTFFVIYKVLRHIDRINAIFLLLEDSEGERFEASLFCDACACFTLRSERTVNIVDFGECGSFLERGSDFFCEITSVFDQCTHFLSAAIEIAQVFESLINCTDGLVVKRAVFFFAVTRNERDGIAFVNQLYKFFYLPRLQIKLRSKYRCVICHMLLRLSVYCVECMVQVENALLFIAISCYTIMTKILQFT